MPICPTSTGASLSSSLVDPAEYLPKARAAARRALELDENLAEGHYALANLLTYAWEWADAEREYKRAIALNPNLALAHRWYAAYLRLVGRHDEAIAEITRARELDPLSPGVNATVGLVLASARRYEPAIATLKRTIELDPGLSVLVPVPGLHLRGSAQVRRRDRRLSEGDHARSRHAGHTDCAWRGVRAGGRHTRARALLARLQSRTDYVSPGELAILLAALGERDEAFAWLEKAHAAHDLQLQYLGVSPGSIRCARTRASRTSCDASVSRAESGPP